MSLGKDIQYFDKTPFEEALNKTGFGLYNFLLMLLTGLIIISFACIAYGTTILVPASACELGTTTAQQGALAAAPFIGSIIGALLWGFLGDTRGRRNMLILCIIISVVFNTLASLSLNWIMMMVLQFFATLAASGKYTLSITLLSESVPLARRNLVLLLVASIFLLSQGIMAVLAIPIIPLSFSYYIPALGIYWNSWRTVVVVYSVPGVISVLCLLFFQESPKFLLLKGEDQKALEVLRVIHRVNKRSGELQVKGLIPEQRQPANTKPKARDQIVPLFQPPLLKYTVIMAALFVFKQVNAFAVWLPRIADQFVSVLQSGEGYDMNLCRIIEASIDTPPDPDAVPCALNESALLMVLAVAGFQSVVNLLISLVVDKTGRRNMVIVTTAVIGVSGVVVNLVPNAVGSAVLFAVYLLGIMTVGLYTAMCVALFPTHLRAMAVSLTLTGGRIATFGSIQILNLMLESNCELGFYVFASIFTSSAVIAAFLPDDRLLKKALPSEEQQETGKVLGATNTKL